MEDQGEPGQDGSCESPDLEADAAEQADEKRADGEEQADDDEREHEPRC